MTVLQNQRAKYGSEGVGTFRPEDAANEIDDGYDCIAWIARQTRCNGKIAMWGSSGTRRLCDQRDLVELTAPDTGQH